MEISTIIAIASILLLIGILISMAIGHLMDRYAVKHSEEARHGTVVMSRAESGPIATAPAVPGTGAAPGPTPVPGGNLTEDQVFVQLALLKTRAGKWYFSGKRLYSLWGGNHDAFLARMREIRGDGPDDTPDDTIVTPIAGRRTRAAYYPGEPDLEYESPPK
jgi:hypothetical protein